MRHLVSGVESPGAAPELVDWWAPGTAVEVVEGPFRGMQGLLVEVRGTGEVAVRLAAVRMVAAVELNPRSVRKIA